MEEINKKKLSASWKMENAASPQRETLKKTLKINYWWLKLAPRMTDLNGGEDVEAMLVQVLVGLDLIGRIGLVLPAIFYLKYKIRMEFPQRERPT